MIVFKIQSEYQLIWFDALTYKREIPYPFGLLHELHLMCGQNTNLCKSAVFFVVEILFELIEITVVMCLNLLLILTNCTISWVFSFLALREWNDSGSTPVPSWQLHFGKEMSHSILRVVKLMLISSIIVLAIDPVWMKTPVVSLELFGNCIKRKNWS